ncbi:DNA polymerase III epsilon subunit-like 3'-5' exonuclease [Shewanella psychrophila]|uniref:DNA polymerase III epsilon subunit-like 3'-5' exonuclease n=1 Tax=Shewanella psychrophila TaxID=225848 RepID=A0A1S6HSY6_9GAMM|nr:exonuclease domain-containing protein [Shewanella psychrophila]AQS38558.1 DNA polymerase III epsilon subunit-like 3'-5' exonuclease [Shewanella psychrophila]
MISQLLKSKLCWRAFRCRSEVMRLYHRGLMSVIAQDISQTQLIALDLEMTGLDPNHDQILSIGLIPIENNLLMLDKAEQKLIKVEGGVGQSAAIHGILDNHLEDAIEIDQAIAWFVEKTQGKVLVAHHAPLDITFLQNAMTNTMGEPVKLLAIDTLAVERKRLLRKHDVLKEGSLRLGACRTRYGLPVYAAHNALVDALACGELLLAQIAAIGQGESLTVAELLAIK